MPLSQDPPTVRISFYHMSRSIMYNMACISAICSLPRARMLCTNPAKNCGREHEPEVDAMQELVQWIRSGWITLWSAIRTK